MNRGHFFPWVSALGYEYGDVLTTCESVHSAAWEVGYLYTVECASSCEIVDSVDILCELLLVRICGQQLKGHASGVRMEED